ncbi:LacI family DNA-binding transcriptional regulator [Oerskovia flava]|uniref:LacI family DNA-binding transcriptional regulator n=1 Tax=Oerskovia flava TaxID=2986422 RepID=UPI00223EE452|nr:LacI family DNA-binding transcriptional regulator [Oerskovia sp. JB1-3-2]
MAASNPAQPDPDATRADRIGLAEIASRAGVSEATVSRVLNRKYGVSPRTRETVEQAMNELGVQRRSRGDHVAILTPNITNPLFAELCERIEERLARHGLRTLVCPVFPGTDQEMVYVESLLRIGVAGAIFLSSSNTIKSSDRTPYRLLQERGVPFVCMNGGFDDVSAPVFSTDDLLAAELAVDHVVTLGHTRIGMAAGPEGNTPADRRVEGFLRATARRGMPKKDVPFVRTSYSAEGGQRAAEQFLAQGVTALVASSDEMALGMMRAVKRQGLTTPTDVSVVGYDDSRLLEYVDPPLTTVRQPVQRLATEIARAVTALVDGREVEVGEMFFDPELVVRASTSTAPGTAVQMVMPAGAP